MSSKFHKGDRVKVIKDDSGEKQYIGMTGTVVKIKTYDTQYPYCLELDNEKIIFAAESELRLVQAVQETRVRERRSDGVAKQQDFMDKLTTFARKVVDPDLRNMIKVGWLDNSLQLTQEGEEVILAEYFFENKEKFGKLAAEQLKEQKKDREK